MIRRLLGLAAAACLLAVTAAGGAGAAAAGSIWQVVPSENPQQHLVTNSLFTGVSAVSGTDGWAVGQFDDAGALGHTLIEHWGGSAGPGSPHPSRAAGRPRWRAWMS